MSSPKTKLTDLPPPDEPYLDALGVRITESEFVLARRHNIYRWILSMLLGIPAFLGLCYYGWIRAVGASVIVLPLIYSGVSWLFPASKKHGTAIYRKYANRRGILIAAAARQKR